MQWHKQTIQIQTRGKGLVNFTDQVQQALDEWGVEEGICHLFIQHTSASLVASESWDPSARQDLEAFMDHLVLEDQPYYRHTLEGSDDSPSHMRAMLTLTSLSIPVDNGRLSLGTWQGIYLFEHRTRAHRRTVLLRCLSID
ncbi:secondary thiamine-phosphate synthase enzyme YjbQ [bacterium]|nr:secondary thiamine-phosphate synthase enzyme YjbQ [bacterium]MCB2179064.1 secondary thiamine-phosphate synthase enzyme YjbQ [bacterium]